MSQGVLDLLPPASERRAGRVRLYGEVQSFRVWTRDDHDWVVGTICRDPDGAVVRFVGPTMSLPELGCRAEIRGCWETHPEFGDQVVVSEIWAQRPRDVDGAIRYIAANVRGCGEAKATRIVRHFGPGTLDVLLRDPERVREALPRASDSVIEGWVAWSEMARTDSVRQRLILRLAEMGVSVRMARTIVRFWRTPDVAEIISLRHPYRLLQVPGFGWQKADEVAQRLGVGQHDPQRICAAVVHTLERVQSAGHTACPVDELVRRTAGLLGQPTLESSQMGVRLCLDRAELREHQGLVYRPGDLELEYGVAECVRGLVRRRRPLSATERAQVDDVLAEAELSAAQGSAVRASLKAGVSVLTGLPGSGKTTTVRALVRAFEALGRKVLVVAPTGKAASRAAQVVGAPASTIHRAIKSVPGLPPETPLSADVVIVDESGMVSLSVAHWLLRSIDPTRTQVVWVGDEHQLPSVEHGYVLGDLIGSNVVPTSRLTEVFRQGRDSGVVRFARAILAGDDPSRIRGRDLVVRSVHRRQELAALLAAVDRLVARFGIGGVAVLAPYRRHALGVIELNRVLQDRLNPAGAVGPFIGGGVRVRCGDRVIQTKNVYDLPSPVFNGETGVALAVDTWSQSVHVDWGDRVVEVAGVHLMRLELAWATTVHRSQGSEYPAVAVLLGGGGHRLLSKQLLYTAATRTREQLVVIESRGAIQACLDRSEAERHTGLRQILREVVGSHATH